MRVLRFVAVTLFVAGALLGGGDRAADRARDFSGKWKADLAQSDFGSMTPPKSLIRTVDQGSLYVTIVAALETAHGRRTSELRFTLDGEESVNQVGATKITGLARMLGSHLLLTTTRTIEGEKVALDELWSLSPDGKTLTVEGLVRTSVGEEPILVVFHRLEP